uniref:Feruloyl-CoA synthetase n=1 Tax=Rhodococcus opacus TaxID=37919 RepID=Q4KWI7_RHOOP|nr:feruloyl-CoA synthetase [Rhodococcus opacus PD630]
MDNEGIGSWLERRITMTPKNEALVFDGRAVTYEEMALRTRRLAHGLHALGVEKGDCVGFFGFNDPAALEVMFAAGLLGATYLPLNARLTAEEARYVLGDSRCTTVIFGDQQADVAGAGAVGHPGHHLDRPGRLVVHPHVRGVHAGQPDTRIDEQVGLDDLSVLMYSSGTTGAPKGVMLSHGNMLWNALNQLLAQDMTSKERTLSVAPLFHIGGIGGAVTPTLLNGGTVVLLRKFDAGVVLDTIEKERITTFFAVPTMIQELWHHPRFADADLSSLRAICVAGAPLPEALISPWQDRDVAITQAYGLTETAPSVTMLSSADVRSKIGSAGKRTFFTDVDVVRPDGSSAEPHEIGEIVAKGPNVMLGYLNQPEATARTIVDGWLHTGDAGYFDDEGFLFICDRYKDMYISGGENVYPAEVEAALLRLEGIREAAVIGVPHEKWGETGMAFVVAADGTTLDEETVRARLREKLAGFKIPTFIQIAEALPRTATGKIRKPDLRKLAASRL